MTAIRPEQHAPFAQLRAIVARVVETYRRGTAQVARSLSREEFNRRVLYRLNVSSDRELGQLGLTRADVVEAASQDGRDATHFLLDRRDGRRNARHLRYPF